MTLGEARTMRMKDSGLNVSSHDVALAVKYVLAGLELLQRGCTRTLAGFAGKRHLAGYSLPTDCVGHTIGLTQ